MTKYAIKVPLSVDDYIYVTEPTDVPFEVKPVLYETENKAKQAASIWGPLAKVVEYETSID